MPGCSNASAPDSPAFEVHLKNSEKGMHSMFLFKKQF